MIQWDIFTTKEKITDIRLNYLRSFTKYFMSINRKILMLNVSTLQKLKIYSQRLFLHSSQIEVLPPLSSDFSAFRFRG